MKSKSIIASMLIAASLTGCATHSYTDAPNTLGIMYSKFLYLGYSGDIQPIDDVGIITTDGIIKIKELDGQPIGSYQVFKSTGFYSGGRYQLHLLPGHHTLKMGFRDDRGDGRITYSKTDLTREINIDKGQVIHLTVAYPGNRQWGVNMDDGSKAMDTILADFKSFTKK